LILSKSISHHSPTPELIQMIYDSLDTVSEQLFAVLDQMNAEDYGYYIAYGEVPTSSDSANQTEAA